MCLGPEDDPLGWSGLIEKLSGKAGADLPQSVIREYDEAMSPAARAAAVNVLIASREQLMDVVGQVTAQRDALVKSLGTAIQWLDLLAPIGEVPGMKDLRAALVQAQAPLRVSHGICLPCVRINYPDMYERVSAVVKRAGPKAPGLLHVCAYCSTSMDGGQ